MSSSGNGTNHTAENEQNSSSSGDSSSDFDDVDVMIEQDATEDISIPLVRAAAAMSVNGSGSHTNSAVARNGSALMLTASKEGGDAEDGGNGTTSPTPTIQPFIKMVDGIQERKCTLTLMGPVHSGKTTLSQLLLGTTDSHNHQQSVDRGISVRTEVCSGLISGALNQQSKFYTVLDTPGHPAFFSDAAAGLRMSDVGILCLDVSEHFSTAAEQAIRQIVLVEQLPLVLLFTKLDRLVLDLHLPPERAYEKLRYLIDSVNNVIIACGGEKVTATNREDAKAPLATALVSPLNGTVCFSSAKFGCFFTVDSFARKYAQSHPGTNPATLATRFWGPIEYNPAKKGFGPTSFARNTTFVKFILEPLYKIFAHSIAGKAHSSLSEDLPTNPKNPIASTKDSMKYFVGSFQAEMVDALSAILPTPERRNSYLSSAYDYADQSDATVAITALATTGTTPDEVLAVLRISQGVLTKGMRLFPVGSRALPPVTIANIFVRLSQGLVEVEGASAGTVVAVRGMPLETEPHCMLVTFEEELNERQVPTIHSEPALMHVSVDAVKPSEATSLRHGLTKLTKTFPGLRCDMEDTGAYTLGGAGELQFEAALFDLRTRFCQPIGSSIHLSAPYVTFSETVETIAFSDKLGTPGGILAVEAPDSRHSIAMVAGCMSNDLVRKLEHQLLPIGDMSLYTVLRKDYGWDAFSEQRGVFALGPDVTRGTNMLVDDSISGMWSSADDGVIGEVVSGFQMATRHGPLCSSVVRGVRFDIVSNLPEDASGLDRTTYMRCARRAMMGANPRLMEPQYSMEIVTLPSFKKTIEEILIDRRGMLTGEIPCPASPLVVLRAQVPMVDAFGLETQVRALTGGKAFPTSRFDGWSMVPGDPFDRTAELQVPTEPARGVQLARDFVTKTRHRMGMAADPETMQ